LRFGGGCGKFRISIVDKSNDRQTTGDVSRTMPLEKSASKEAFSTNVAEMIKAGHPQAQAVAAAYATKRKAEGKPARAPKERKTRRNA
jgi:hypothetical protein